jgi:hypothetical protein
MVFGSDDLRLAVKLFFRFFGLLLAQKVFVRNPVGFHLDLARRFSLPLDWEPVNVVFEFGQLGYRNLSRPDKVVFQDIFVEYCELHLGVSSRYHEFELVFLVPLRLVSLVQRHS